MTEPPPITNQSPASTTPPEPPKDEPRSFWERWGELIVALGVLALGIVVLVETQNIRTRPGVVVSPRTFPTIVGIGLVLVALWYTIDVVRAPHRAEGGGEDAEDVDPEAETDWKVLAILAVGLVVYTVLMEYVGFILASAALLVIAAFAMGSRQPARDTIIGLILGIGIYLLFNSWLGVRLPGGWLEGLF